MRYPDFAHTAIITGATGCGKTEYIMNLLTTEYENYFDAVIVICPTFDYNDAYKKRSYLFDREKFYNGITDFYVWTLRGSLADIHRKYPPKRGVGVNDSVRCLREQFQFYGKLLFVVDDLAADVETSRKNTELSKLAVSGRHTSQSLWVLTQKYNMIAKEIRSQAKFITSFYTKDKRSFDDMINENWTGDVDKEKIYDRLMKKRHAYIIIKVFQPCEIFHN